MAHQKTKNCTFLIIILFIIFLLKIINCPCTFKIFDISPCTLVSVPQPFLKIKDIIIILFIILIENNYKQKNKNYRMTKL